MAKTGKDKPLKKSASSSNPGELNSMCIFVETVS